MICRCQIEISIFGNILVFLYWGEINLKVLLYILLGVCFILKSCSVESDWLPSLLVLRESHHDHQDLLSQPDLLFSDNMMKNLLSTVCFLPLGDAASIVLSYRVLSINISAGLCCWCCANYSEKPTHELFWNRKLSFQSQTWSSQTWSSQNSYFPLGLMKFKAQFLKALRNWALNFCFQMSDFHLN